MTSARRKSVLGKAGESHALRFLEAHGHRLVTLDGDMLVFVEVKTRRGERAGRADDAVSPAKRSRFLASAEWFLTNHPEHQDRIWRCDLVAIAIDATTGVATVRHYPNALVSG